MQREREREREREIFSVFSSPSSSYEVTNTVILKAFMPPLILTTSLKALSPNVVTGGLGLQHLNFGGIQNSIISNTLLMNKLRLKEV